MFHSLRNLFLEGIKHEVYDSHNNETYGRTTYTDNGDVIGYIDWSTYNKVVHIKYIFVDKKFRKQGIASKLLDSIFSEFDSYAIDLGGLTDDGSKFIQKYFTNKPNYVSRIYKGDPIKTVDVNGLVKVVSEKFPGFSPLINGIIKNGYEKGWEQVDIHDILKYEKEYGIDINDLCYLLELGLDNKEIADYYLQFANKYQIPTKEVHK